MLVKHRMSAPVLTISPDVSVMDALQLMKQKNVRRFPVVDNKGRLVGIVSEKDLLRAAPSQATALSIFEITYLLHKLTVGEVMTQEVVTVSEDTPLEAAARIMAERHLGGLPVLEGDKVVGIITETDILLGFSEALGAFEPGVRITLQAPDQRGILAGIVNKVYSLGGNIASLTVMRAREPKIGYIVAKVQGVQPGELANLLNDGTVVVIDVREISSGTPI